MEVIFPDIPQNIPPQAADKIGRVPAFESGHFLVQDGMLAERSGSAAVKQWFELALRQQIDKIPIYRTEGVKKFGIPRDIIGAKLPQGLIAAEMERAVLETASFNPAVQAIREYRAEREGRICVITFKAILRTGEQVEVRVDV